MHARPSHMGVGLLPNFGLQVLHTRIHNYKQLKLEVQLVNPSQCVCLIKSFMIQAYTNMNLSCHSATKTKPTVVYA